MYKIRILALAAVALAPLAAAHAQTLQTLYNFQGGADAANPGAPLFDYEGRLYGTALVGGLFKGASGPGGGAVFSFDPVSNAESVMHRFPGFKSKDGHLPTSGLVELGGLLYGVTQVGGPQDDGTVYRVNPKTGKEEVVHAFTGSDGNGPVGELLVLDGQLFGSARTGGSANKGILFRLDPATGVLTTIHQFSGTVDGSAPMGGFVYLDGRLYGTTAHGGAYGHGVVFSFDLATASLSVLHAFAGAPDGDYPGELVRMNGLIYGTTDKGGTANAGTVFALDPATGMETTLYSFAGGTGGRNPDYSALAPFKGALYGTTISGGANNQGIVYAIDPASGNETPVYSFTGGADGGSPNGLHSFNGVLYGVAYQGGAYNDGTVFRLMP